MMRRTAVKNRWFLESQLSVHFVPRHLRVSENVKIPYKKSETLIYKEDVLTLSFCIYSKAKGPILVFQNGEVRFKSQLTRHLLEQ